MIFRASGFSSGACSGFDLEFSAGTPAPDPAGGLDLPEGAILYLTADAPAFTSGQAVASVRSKGVLYAFLVDGQPAADPFGLLGGSGGSQALPGGIYTFRCGAGSRLTIAVQFLTVPPSMENLPSITLYDGVADYDSQNVHLGAFSSLLIGLFLTIAFLMLAIFLMQLWRGAPEWGSLLLAVTALAICLNRTILYADIMRNTLKDPGLYLIVRYAGAAVQHKRNTSRRLSDRFYSFNIKLRRLFIMPMSIAYKHRETRDTGPSYKLGGIIRICKFIHSVIVDAADMAKLPLHLNSDSSAYIGDMLC